MTTRIYYGREPEHFECLDTLFRIYMRANNWDLPVACRAMFGNLREDGVYHTLNPIIPNFLDDEQACEWLWIIDNTGQHVRMGVDDHMLKKLVVMQPGEVVADDYRSVLWEGE